MPPMPYLHDPECDCRAEFFCASLPPRWCFMCGHARSQHFQDGSGCAVWGCPDHDYGEFVEDTPLEECRRCSLCEDLDHHWLMDADADLYPEGMMRCKHCPAMREITDDDFEEM